MPDEEDYAGKALRTAEAHTRRRVSASKYRSTKHVSPTTNIVGRANSQAKLIMTDKRERLAPETLNTLMILKHNKSLWHSDASIQEILESGDFRDPDIGRYIESEDPEEEDA